ncbi:MAG: pitrilysin family protein [Microscillaceae bacterium]|nr:pitrilysin family protein [Microscillaceae bacterium]
MIHYEHFTLANGLQFYFHQDKTSPIAVVNVLYNVGSKDEDEEKTGFAHLFEHLMFRGSRHIPNYDKPLQKVGGENNAFTSPDVTNYYITLPVVNLETAFWLESDRMLGLDFREEVLEAEKNVVIEEFKQRYLNQPYGDVWLRLRPLAYQVHPYRWATIGKDISHIERATMDDVQAFFNKYYIPNNAIVVVVGNTTLDHVKHLAEKWFAPIAPGVPYRRNLPQEPNQREARLMETEADVPLDSIYKVYHMPARMHPAYYAVDLLSDIMGRGKSCRLYSELVKEKNIFNSVNAYVVGSSEPGLMVIQGNLHPETRLEDADAELEAMIEIIKREELPSDELQKVKNKAESTLIFSEVELLNRAINLAFYAAQGHVNRINEESDRIQSVTVEDVRQTAKDILRKENSSTLYYRKRR